MPFGFLRSDGSDRLERIEATLQRMFVDDGHSFDLAMSALFGDTPARDVGGELRDTDGRVNESEREIRRELVVHAGVYGGIETPSVLVYMSIVKDVERIGDYAKNLFDIAADGVVLDDGSLHAEIVDLRSSIATMITEVAGAFGKRDTGQSRELLVRGDEMLDEFDTRVSQLVTGQVGEPHAVAYALVYRYFKRIVAHLMNVLSAVVMPVDRLDYFDEDPEDR